MLNLQETSRKDILSKKIPKNQLSKVFADKLNVRFLCVFKKLFHRPALIYVRFLCVFKNLFHRPALIYSLHKICDSFLLHSNVSPICCQGPVLKNIRDILFKFEIHMWEPIWKRQVTQNLILNIYYPLST